MGGSAALAAAIADPNMVVLPDPDPAKAAHFDPRSATAGVAFIAPALDKADIHTAGCSALSPCAMPTPARSDAAVTVPTPTERVSDRRRVRRRG